MTQVSTYAWHTSWEINKWEVCRRWRHICRFRSLLFPSTDLNSLANALVSSRFGYCNKHLIGITRKNLYMAAGIQLKTTNIRILSTESIKKFVIDLQNDISFPSPHTNRSADSTISHMRLCTTKLKAGPWVPWELPTMHQIWFPLITCIVLYCL